MTPATNFISSPTEVDVDCISDGEVSVIGAIMQHIEEEGIHSGDSAEGRPHVIDMIKNDEIDLIINTPSVKTPRKDEVKIRSAAVERRIPILTTISGVEASIRALSKIRKLQPRVAKRYRALLFERVRKIGLEITLDDDRLTKRRQDVGAPRDGCKRRNPQTTPRQFRRPGKGDVGLRIRRNRASLAVRRNRRQSA